MATRYNINDFALANPAYVGGTVSFWTVSGGAKTATLATLYAASTGSTTLANPRTLDSDGKFSVPVYVEVPTIATVSGLTVADHDTGIMGLAETAASTSAAAAAASAAAALASQTAAAASAAAASAAITGIGQRSATTVGGTVDAITATFTPVFASLAASAGIVLAIPLAGANTSTTPSLAIDGLTAKTIVKWSGTALVAGDIPGGDFVGLLAYDASADKFQLLNPASATVSQVDAEAGTSQVVKNWTPERVAQAIDALGASGATGDVQTFNAGGTWTKPASGTMALIEVWGAGGGGARQATGNSTGGGGGGYTFLWKKLSDLGATETVTIGAGGAAQSTDATAGNNGGLTSFGAHISHVGGTGGSRAAAGASAVAPSVGGVGAVQGIYNATGVPGANSTMAVTSAVALLSTPLGTAGMPGNAATDGAASSGLASFMGGGCGGCVSTVLNAQGTGGTSAFGGAGGNGNKAGAGGTGAQPGGGGGAGTTQGGAGGDGRVKVSVF